MDNEITTVESAEVQTDTRPIRDLIYIVRGQQVLAVIIVTGVLGNMMLEPVCKLFRITNPISKGLAAGTASHAIGTAKAMELGEVEGAMSSLAIVVSGLITVGAASVFAMLY